MIVPRLSKIITYKPRIFAELPLGINIRILVYARHWWIAEYEW